MVSADCMLGKGTGDDVGGDIGDILGNAWV